MNTAELKNIDRTPYEDTIEAAELIWLDTRTSNGATFIHYPALPVHGLPGGWTAYEGDGYAVGGYQDTVEVKLGAVDPVIAIARFIERIPSRVDGSKHFLLGTWIESGVLYIDAVKIWAEEDDALNEARKNGEKAVYHFNSERTIYVEPAIEPAPIFPDTSPDPVLNDAGDVIAINLDGKRFVPIEDVLALLQNELATFDRLAKAPKDSLTELFEHYAYCVEHHIIPGIGNTFGK